MKKNKLLRNAFIIALIVWIVMLIKQQINIAQYKEELNVLESKIEVAEDKLNQNKQDLTKKTKYTIIRIYRTNSTWKTRNVFTKWKSLCR